jgi:membrane associated rhomboid family serine protease
MFPIHDDNPVSIIPVVTYAVIAACVGVFIWQITRSPDQQQIIIYALGAIPAVLLSGMELGGDIAMVPDKATVFTSMFLHGGWMHLIGNMLFLWVFGNNIEAAMGHVKYAAFYLLCGIAAFFAQALPDTASQIPMIGASGAISGVLGAYLLLYPRARVLIVIPIFFILKTMRLPAMLVLGIWFVMQLVSSVLNAGQEGGVAFGAHIGGFVAGMVLVGLFKKSSVNLLIPFVHFNPFNR